MQVTIKFQVPPTCEIPKLISNLVSQLGVKVDTSATGSDMTVRAWDRSVNVWWTWFFSYCSMYMFVCGYFSLFKSKSVKKYMEMLRQLIVYFFEVIEEINNLLYDEWWYIIVRIVLSSFFISPSYYIILFEVIESWI